MKQFKSKCGYIIFKCTALEIISIGGLGICDHCNNFSEVGYLIPVLNHWLCESCFLKWDENSTYYPEDIPFEKKNTKYYLSHIPLT